MAWVLGYGSLLHPDSLRRTLPQVSPAQIRPVQVAGARRIFNLVSPGWARLAGGIQGEKVAALNAVPAKDCRMNAVAFWLGEEEVEPLDRREFCYYKVLDVPFVEWAAGDGQTGRTGWCRRFWAIGRWGTCKEPVCSRQTGPKRIFSRSYFPCKSPICPGRTASESSPAGYWPKGRQSEQRSSNCSSVRRRGSCRRLQMSGCRHRQAGQRLPTDLVCAAGESRRLF